MKDILDVKLSFAEKLKELIEEKGWDLKTFAQLVDIPRSTINDYTLANTTAGIDNLCKIADFFGVTTDYLLGRED